MAKWRIEIRNEESELQDLEAFSRSLPEVDVIREGDRYYVTANVIDDPQYPLAVGRLAEFILRWANRATLAFGRSRPFELGQAVSIDENGHRRVFNLHSTLPTTGAGGYYVVPAPELIAEYSAADIRIPETHLEIVHFAPSLAILEKLRRSQMDLDALHWREFEELIANLLEREGYTVKLGPGRKDGGKDLIAIKNHDLAGPFMAVWQMKKLQPGNKVEVSTVRELADTRNLEGASTGVIATTGYLTKGALERVRLEQYRLSKVDRDDLIDWIRRI